MTSELVPIGQALVPKEQLADVDWSQSTMNGQIELVCPKCNWSGGTQSGDIPLSSFVQRKCHCGQKIASTVVWWTEISLVNKNGATLKTLDLRDFEYVGDKLLIPKEEMRQARREGRETEFAAWCRGERDKPYKDDTLLE